ncbi:Pol protein, partial [Phytophthora palmivora]
MAEFAINNLVHASTGHTPFFVNAMRHPRLPSVLGAVAPSLSGGGSTVGTDSMRNHAQDKPVANKSKVFVPGTDTTKTHAQAGPIATTSDMSVPGTDTLKDTELNGNFSSTVMDFVQERQAVIRFVQDAIAASVDRQKLNADSVGRGNTNEFEKGSLVLLATQNLPTHATSAFGTSKLAPRFIGPFTVFERHGNAYTLDLPSNMRLHPTFYVGRLKLYLQPESPSSGDSSVTRGLASVRSQHQLLLWEQASWHLASSLRSRYFNGTEMHIRWKY